MSTLYRHEFGTPLPTASEPAPVPTIERIPRTIDGCTWYAYALAQFSERWAMFA